MKKFKKYIQDSIIKINMIEKDIQIKENDKKKYQIQMPKSMKYQRL